MSSSMQPKRPQKPFLAPLGAAGLFSRRSLDRLPPAAMPVAVTLVGALALVVGLGIYLGQRSPGEPAGVPVAAVAEEPSAPEAQATPDAAPADAGTQAEAEPPVEPEQAAAEPAQPVEPAASEAAASGVDPVEPPAQEPFEIAAPAIDETATPDIETDLAPTSAIPPAAPGRFVTSETVPVAETIEEIAELEEIQMREVEADVGTPSPEETASIPPATPRVKATTTKWVNMRSAPSDEGEVLQVVPALATVDAEAGCDWCAVAYEGREGFIYKTFLSYEGEAAANESPAAAVKPVADERPVEELQPALENPSIEGLPGVE